MTESSIRNTKIGCGVFMIVGMGSIYGYFHFANLRRVEAITGERGGNRIIAAPGSPRLNEIRRVQGRDPGAALKIADEILAKPVDNDERRGALFQRPELLRLAAVKLLRAGQRAEAQALRARLEQTYPASPQVELLRREWRQALANVAVATLENPDHAVERAAFDELWAAGPEEPDKYAFSAWSDKLVTRWRTWRVSDNDGTRAIQAQAAAVLPQVSTIGRVAGEFARADTTPAKPLADRGHELARAERSPAALVFWRAALLKLEQGGTWAGERQLDPKARATLVLGLKKTLATGAMELGDRLRRGERPPYVMFEPREAYTVAAEFGHGQAEELEALLKSADYLATVEMPKLAEPVLKTDWAQLANVASARPENLPVLTAAASEVKRIMGQWLATEGVRVWECCLETPGFDPWPSVPAAVREAIDGVPAVKRPEAERRKALVAHYRQDVFRIPLGEFDPLRALLHQVYARWAILELAHHPDSAFTLARWVLREPGADPALRDQLGSTLRALLKRSREADDFEGFYTIAGFYAAEVGLPPAGDPFRAEFRQGLDAAVKSFRKTSRMKLLFLLTLVADLFPEEPAGKEARKEAFATAFEELKTQPAQRRTEQMPLGLIPGCSIELLDNSTNYHLLAFYRGPEEIFVHNWPWRRGTVVLPDGDYEIVVLSPDGFIKPFRGLISPRTSVRTANYVIEKTSGRRDEWTDPSWATANGDYRLLYATARAGAVKLEPRTGLPLPKR